MKEEKKNASNEASVGSGADQHSPADVNYTTNKEIIEAREKFFNLLPPDVKARSISGLDRALQDYLKSGGEASYEALLSAIVTIDSVTLLMKKFEPIPWIVPDLLPPGLTILSGKPKVGKSWMALQLALSVIAGGKAFGKDVSQGKVLYLALEDSERRLQDRMKKQGWSIAQEIKVDFLLYGEFYEKIGSLNSGGGLRLLKKIEAERYRLVIVDTFSRAIRGDQIDSNDMTEAIGPIQQKALELDVAFVMCDHMRKNTGAVPDPISDVFGSVAKAGILDTAWALYKEQGKRGAKLSISGRDVDSLELQLTFKVPGYFWNCEGDAYEVYLTRERKKILEALDDLGEANNRRISEYLKRDESNTLKQINDLCNSGMVEMFTKDKGKRKFYRLVED